MSDHTVVNLKEVENQAPNFGMPAEMEARFARRSLGLEDTGITHFKLGPGVRIPFGHRHRDQEEVYVVVSGSARIKVGDDIVDLRQWDAIRVPGDVIRNLEGGADGAEVLAFGQAAGAEESEMVPGWWSD
jgi:mannose-6-phosphate isomerase-like protein (cupin superfamily)